MSHAEICPVCRGKGIIPTEDGTDATKICHGCNGRGWIPVNDPYPIYPPEYYPWWTNPIYYCFNR